MIKLMLRSMVLPGIIFFNLASTDCEPTDLIEISGSELFVPKNLGDIKVFHDAGGFKIKKSGTTQKVQNCFLDKEIRNLSNNELSRFLGTLKEFEIDGEAKRFVKLSIDDF